jgi:O-antigen ligase
MPAAAFADAERVRALRSAPAEAPAASRPGAAILDAQTQEWGRTLVLPARAPLRAPSRSPLRSMLQRAAVTVGRPAGTTLLCAGALCGIAFGAGGGLALAPTTNVEMALTLACGAILAGVILVPAAAPGAARRPLYGVPAALLLTGLAALTAISAAWSVQPDASWQEANRVLAYAGLFALAVALARAAPGRWRDVIGGVTLACVVVSAYALLTKVFPGALDPSDPFARLLQPYGYWIATGLTAAMGAVGCLWMGARRDGHALWRVLAFPAMGLSLVTLLLTYSRGPLAALAIGLVAWFVLVPLRVRGAAVLLTGAAGAAGVVAFAFSNHALSSEHIALAQRASAGHQLGVLLAGMLVALTLAGGAICFANGRRAPSPRTRRRLGAALIAIPALALVVGVGGLAASHRGLVGTLGHSFDTLTNPNAPTPANTPGRLTAIASVRARYWKEALEIFGAHPLLGAGGEGYATARLHYRTETLHVQHAHGFIVQTLADLGALGLAVVLALFAAWLIAARRPTRPLRWREAYTPERVALLSMLCIVLVFGAHSLVDWTWYVPGNAAIALLCAGWLAGRGPLARARAPLGAGHAARGAGPPRARESRAPRAAGRARAPVARLASTLARPRVAAALAVAAVALLGAYTQWQPERSASAAESALAQAGRNDPAALASARHAVSVDPLSAEALRVLAFVQGSSGETAAAEATLRRAVRLQPSNPQTWEALGEHDLQQGNYGAALAELRAAVYLNPEAVQPESVIAQAPDLVTLRNAYLEALRATAGS